MSLRLVKGKAEDVETCSHALLESELGKRYFGTLQNCEAAILEFAGTEYFLVALDENDVFWGFLCYIQNGAFHSYPFLHIVAVTESGRGRGYGSQIMDIFESMVFQCSRLLFLVVADFNPGAKKFYLQRGFEQVGEVPSLYREGICEYLMMKTRPFQA